MAQRAIGVAELGAGASYAELKVQCHQALAAYQYSPGRECIEVKERNLNGGAKAIEGLRAYAMGGTTTDEEATSAKRRRASEKLAGFAASDEERRAEVEAARASCPEWAQKQALAARLEEEQLRIGLPALERHAKSLERQRGREASKGGKSFEQDAGTPLGEILLERIRVNETADASVADGNADGTADGTGADGTAGDELVLLPALALVVVAATVVEARSSMLWLSAR